MHKLFYALLLLGLSFTLFGEEEDYDQTIPAEMLHPFEKIRPDLHSSLFEEMDKQEEQEEEREEEFEKN